MTTIRVRCPRRASGALAALVAVLVAAGCTAGQTAADEGLPVPDPVPTVDVELADEELTVEGPVPAGHVVFHVTNTGTRPHRVLLFPLGDDWPPIHEEIANDIDQPVLPHARVPDLEPGETGRFATDLAEGKRYGLIDRSTAPSGEQHLAVGVAGEFTAEPQPAPSPTSTPTPEG